MSEKIVNIVDAAKEQKIPGLLVLCMIGAFFGALGYLLAYNTVVDFLYERLIWSQAIIALCIPAGFFGIVILATQYSSYRAKKTYRGFGLVITGLLILGFAYATPITITGAYNLKDIILPWTTVPVGIGIFVFLTLLSMLIEKYNQMKATAIIPIDNRSTLTATKPHNNGVQLQLNPPENNHPQARTRKPIPGVDRPPTHAEHERLMKLFEEK